jgi:hypothetical protein
MHRADAPVQEPHTVVDRSTDSAIRLPTAAGLYRVDTTPRTQARGVRHWLLTHAADRPGQLPSCSTSLRDERA